MKNIEYASINGVEVRNLAEQDCEDDILYTGELWMDGEKIGAFEEVFESETKLVIQPEYLVKLEERIRDYLEGVQDDEEEDLPREVFFMDLIELERYFQMFKEGVEEGYGCLLVNYTDESIDVFSVESEEEIENIVRENNFEDFQVFSKPEHFVISCSSEETE
ncbi:MAG: hypothetical protein SOZ52_04370 [Pyramidobacter sp.]|nr:hypothetical protein [Pyramidobacter sp.]